jgi:hypothetical protein
VNRPGVDRGYSAKHLRLRTASEGGPYKAKSRNSEQKPVGVFLVEQEWWIMGGKDAGGVGGFESSARYFRGTGF